MSDYELLHAYETVNLQRAGGAARIELNRPETMNAWDATLARDLLAALARVRRRRRVRAVLLTGAGRGFCSGADLSAGFDPTPDGPARPPDARCASATTRSSPTSASCPSRSSRRSTAAAVGIGCSLALACDLILAAESAYFLLAFVNIGLVPDGGSSPSSRRASGSRARSRWRCSASGSTAPKALEWGLINARPRRRRAARPPPTRSSPASPPARRAPTRAPSASSTRGCTRAGRSSSSWRPRSSRRRRGTQRLRRGRHGVPAEAPGRVRGPLSHARHRATPWRGTPPLHE